MNTNTPNSEIIDRIMRAIEAHDRVRPSMKGNHLESIENMLHGALGEKDAEIARLKEALNKSTTWLRGASGRFKPECQSEAAIAQAALLAGADKEYHGCDK